MHKMKHRTWTVFLLWFAWIPFALCDSQSLSAKTTLSFVKELRNVTKESGDYMRLRCEVEGSPPATQFTWMKHGVPITEERDHIKVKTRLRSKDGGTQWSQLRFEGLQTLDTAYYTCKVTNGIDTIESTAVVKVNYGSGGRNRPGTGWGNYDDYSDGQEAGGLLPKSYSEPDFTGSVEFEGGQMPSSERGGNKQRGAPSPGGSKLGKNIPNLRPDERRGSCQPYVGSVCAKFVGQEYIFVSEGLSQEYVEQKLSAAFSVISASPDLSQECSPYAIPAICLSTFPLCDRQTERPRKLCREECEVLESRICRKELAIARQYAALEKQLVLPECPESPPVGSPESANCVRVGISEVRQLIKPHSCYKGDGGDYRGTISTTESGLMCQPWNRHPLFKVLLLLLPSLIHH